MSTFGSAFRVTTFGESHCRGVGAIVDGVPPLLSLTEQDIQPQLTRRRPGQSRLTTPRAESDLVTIMSGTENGVTLGTPIGLFVPNRNVRPGDYKEMSRIPRPGHADYSYQVKYGVRAASGGGRSSARETIGRVAAGAIAEKYLRQAFGTSIVSFVSSVGSVALPPQHWRADSGRAWSREDVDTKGTLRVLRHPQHWARHDTSGAVSSSVADTSGVEGGGGAAQSTASTPAAPQGQGGAQDAAAQAAAAQAAADATDEAAFVAGMATGAYDALPCYEAWDGTVLGARGAVLGCASDAFTYPGQAAPVTLVHAGNRTDEVVPVRCPHPPTAAAMASLIRITKAAHDSIGGTVVTVATGVPIGLGEPVFDKAEAMLAHAMLSLPATKGFEIGSGFQGTLLNGSQHNDPFALAAGAASVPGDGAAPTAATATVAEAEGGPQVDAGHEVPHTAPASALLRPTTNNAGGTLGGITNGAPLVFRVAVKPVSTIGRPQPTATFAGAGEVLEAKGRHDPCVLPRTPPLTEAMTALVLADLALQQAARVGGAAPGLAAVTQAGMAAALSGPCMPVLPVAATDVVALPLQAEGGAKRPREGAGEGARQGKQSRA